MDIATTKPADPWALFADWFALATQNEPSYPDAMSLATVGEGGMPFVRTVLMKGFDREGIVFYTNRESRKGHQLLAHPKAGMCFYWKSLQRQVHIEGDVSRVSDAESDTYFATRPRASQLGAWASLQSRPLESRALFEERIAQYDKTYQDQAVPRPPHWGGYRLSPSIFEFWQEQLYRWHDRLSYRRNGEAWEIERLYP